MDNKRFGSNALLALTLTLGGACSDSDDESYDDSSGTVTAETKEADQTSDAGEAQGTIVDVAAAAGTFNTLADALMKTGLDDALAGEGPFTVFAPTDAAFAKLPAGTLESLTDEQLADILQYHVISGEVRSTELEAGPVKMLNGISAFVKLDEGVTINDAKVTAADVDADNGVIHVIDTVLLPPNLAQAATLAGGFDSVLSAVQRVGLDPALAGDTELTVFAPTDEAFAALPPGTVESLTNEQLTQILQYHVVPGAVLSTDLETGEIQTLSGGTLDVVVNGGVSVNDAKVVTADIVTTNGVIHAVDAVLLPR